MLYIYDSACISPQQSFGSVDLDTLRPATEGKLLAVQPAYDGIPPGLLRRMGKAVKLGIGAALPLLHQRPPVQAIIVGTANGGMEDCIRFLNQIIEYEEGILAPGNFVQSTANAVASQLGMLTRNKCYNMTHVHRSLSFENALLDAAMVSEENPGALLLVGGVDEISAYNYNIEWLAGWYKSEKVANADLYTHSTPGSLAGEGSAMFLVGHSATGARARCEAIETLHDRNAESVGAAFRKFLEKNPGPVDWLLSGENGDSRLTAFYQACEASLPASAGIARYKHLCGESPTASAFGTWFGLQILTGLSLPAHTIKKPGLGRPERMVLYNTDKGHQHSFMILSLA